MVCRTGMHTVMGDMIRQLLAPTKLYKAKDPFLTVRSCLVEWLVLYTSRLSCCMAVMLICIIVLCSAALW